METIRLFLFTLLCSSIASVIAFASPPKYGWAQSGSDIDGENVFDRSGDSVAMSSDGTRIAIGAISNYGNGYDTGHVRIYDWSGSAWIQLGLDIDGESEFDYSGCSVAMSADGSRVAIGAYDNDGNGINSGHVRIYDWSGSAWIQLGLDIDGESGYDYSGRSVAMSSDGSRVAIGAPFNDGNGFATGHVRIYHWSGSAWIQLGLDIDSEASGDLSGYSVAMSSDGSRVAIGAYGNDGSGDNSGHVRIYDWSGSAWIQLGLDIDGESKFDYSGYSVAMSADGSRVAIGAYRNTGDGTDAGHVRIYYWSGSAWIQLGLDIDGELENDNSGRSVAMSADGSRVAIGAPGNDGNGYNSGHVRIYNWNGSTWMQLGLDIDGEGASDLSGESVAMSSDGSRVAIGAPFNAAYRTVNSFGAGHVRVYHSALITGVAMDDAATSTTGYTVVYPLANDTGNVADLAITDVDEPSVFISADGRYLMVPAGYVGTFTYSVYGVTSADVTITAGTILTESKRWAGMLYDEAGLPMGTMEAMRSSSSFSGLIRIGLEIDGVRFQLDPDGSATFSSKFGDCEVFENSETGQLRVLIDGTTYVGTLRRCVESAIEQQYNIALATTDPALLGGGYIVAHVRANGRIVLMGKLPDGRNVSGTAYLADNGSFVFQSVVAKKKGASSLAGEFTIADLASTDVTGQLSWVSDEMTNGLLLAAHDSTLTANGCLFERGVSLLPNGPVTVTFSSGDLISDVIVSTTVTNGLVAPADELRRFKTFFSNGVFLATLSHSDLDQARKGRGVFLPKSNSAWGYFPGSTEGGKIELSTMLPPP